jgi:hypothetical protein
MKNELLVIDFDGVQVKPNKQGVYKCPFKCGNPSYREPTWKTEKGFRGHMTKCHKRPSFLKDKQEKEAAEIAAFEPIRNKILATINLKVGDKIAVVKEWVVKPTHEKRFNRMVRVRYEAVKRFEGIEITVNKIDVRPTTHITSIEQIKNTFLYINDEYHLSDICPSLENAKVIAIAKQKNYDEACEFASQCR